MGNLGNKKRNEMNANIRDKACQDKEHNDTDIPEELIAEILINYPNNPLRTEIIRKAWNIDNELANIPNNQKGRSKLLKLYSDILDVVMGDYLAMTPGHRPQEYTGLMQCEFFAAIEDYDELTNPKTQSTTRAKIWKSRNPRTKVGKKADVIISDVTHSLIEVLHWKLKPRLVAGIPKSKRFESSTDPIFITFSSEGYPKPLKDGQSRGIKLIKRMFKDDEKMKLSNYNLVPYSFRRFAATWGVQNSDPKIQNVMPSVLLHSEYLSKHTYMMETAKTQLVKEIRAKYLIAHKVVDKEAVGLNSTVKKQFENLRKGAKDKARAEHRQKQNEKAESSKIKRMPSGRQKIDSKLALWFHKILALTLDHDSSDISAQELNDYARRISGIEEMISDLMTTYTINDKGTPYTRSDAIQTLRNSWRASTYAENIRLAKDKKRKKIKTKKLTGN